MIRVLIEYIEILHNKEGIDIKKMMILPEVTQ
jgi:hypothetical protein